MRFRVTYVLKCPNCQSEWPESDTQIEAKDPAEADRVFKEKYRLCPICVPTKVKVDFTFVDIEQLSYTLGRNRD